MTDSIEEGDEDEEYVATWETDYQPWALLLKAMVNSGKQAFVLFWVVYEVSIFSFRQTSQTGTLVMYCSADTMGNWVYLCAITHAGIIAFPLFAASVSLTLTTRYILQLRLYYHALRKSSLISFRSYNLTQDNLFRLLALSFSLGITHFVMDFFFPPYFTNQKIINIVISYLLPCMYFYSLLIQICNVQQHVVPVAELFDQDHIYAKELLGNARILHEHHLKTSVANARYALLNQNDTSNEARKEPTVDNYLDLVMTSAARKSAAWEEVEHHSRHIGHIGVMSGQLLSGLWPAQVLLDSCLVDDASVSFRKVMKVFGVLYVVSHAWILTILSTATVWEFHTYLAPEVATQNSVLHDGHYYIRMGPGFCTDSGGTRPDGYYKILGTALNHTRLQFWQKKSNSKAILGRDLIKPTDNEDSPWRQAADHCSSRNSCIGFATQEQQDRAMVAVYFKGAVDAPRSWTNYAMDVSGKASKYSASNIVASDGFEHMACWKKWEKESKLHALAAGFTFLFHILLIVTTLLGALGKMLPPDPAEPVEENRTSGMDVTQLRSSSFNVSPAALSRRLASVWLPPPRQTVIDDAEGRDQ